MTDSHETPAPFDPNRGDMFVDPPKWTTPVGIVSICLASLGLLCGVCGLVGIVFLNSPQMAEQMEKGVGAPMPDVMRPNTVQTVLIVISTLWAGVLLAAGLATLARRETGRMLHLLYAIVAILMGGYGLYLQGQQMGAQKDFFAANPDSPWAKHYSPTGALVGACVGMVFSFSYPLFLIIWFGMGKGKERMR